jgi:hypothetical protein
MSDKRLHIDKKFTDRAWGEMRRMLDAEMPAGERKRRPPLFWWWLLAAALLGGSAIAVWQQNRQPQVKPAPAVAAAGLKSQPAETTNSTVATGAPEESVSPTELIENLAVVKKETHGAVVAPSFFTLTKTNRAGGASERKVATTDVEISQKTPSLSPVVAVPVIAFEGPETTNAGQAATSIEPARMAYAMTGLAYAEIQPLVIPAEKQPDFSAAPVALGRNLSSHAFYAGASTSFPYGAEGLSAGWLKNFRPAESKWSLETGLGYHFVRQPLNITLVETTDPGPSPNTPGSDISTTIEYGYDKEVRATSATEESAVKTSAYQDLALHYAEMPLLAGWQVRPRLRFQAGITASALLVSAPDFTRGGLIEKNNGDLDDQLNSLADADTTAIEISRFDLATSAGLRYTLTKRLSADFRYQFGLTDALKSNNANDFNRLFRLSLIYRL